MTARRNDRRQLLHLVLLATYTTPGDDPRDLRGVQVKEGTNRRRRAPALVATLAAVMALGSTALAGADRASVIIMGKAPEHERSLVASAVNEAVSKASWTVDATAFKPEEIDSIVKCLQNDRPWTCIEPTVHTRQLDRIVIVQVEMKASNTPAISAQLVLADDRIPPEETRFCERCTDATLIASTHDVMSALLRRANELAGDPTHPGVGSGAMLVVSSTPPGATITVDGRVAGKAGERIAIAAGHHTIEIVLPGYLHEQRTIDATTKGDQTLAVELETESHGPTKALPIALIAGGGVLALGCIGYGFTLDPPAEHDQPRILVSWPAVGGVMVGSAAVAAGLYFWFHHEDVQQTSVPTTSLVPGGAVVGWARSF